MQRLNTLFVTLPDSRLRLNNDTLRVEVEQEARLRVPPRCPSAPTLRASHEARVV